ncbi:unnamed protein product [Somion occarium]|uniref:Dicer-like protein 2 n=1 Tax=Somion occarium TaxID=3059160 RepID=A0ABP1E0A0_9APHY
MDVDTEDTAGSQPQQQFQTRGYQQELLDESFRRNIIIALDTGSGKTHIAVLRMKMEVERTTNKICWFLAPTVSLIEQQRNVIGLSIPVNVGMVSGQSEPDQWKDAKVWQKLLEDYSIMVTTPQILLDALSHGFVSLGQLSLLVFDEAHHATSKHPYNTIMRDFYFKLPARNGSGDTTIGVRPVILGLTASPIYGGDLSKAFRELESNLDSVILSSKVNREELAQHVHRPIFKHVLWNIPEYSYDEIPWTGPSANVIALNAVVNQLNIDEDPYVVSLRAQLAKLPVGNQRTRVDQKLSKTINKADTFSHKGLRDFLRAACDICWELGPWAADWYVNAVVKQAQNIATVQNVIMSTWQEEEKKYLLSALAQVSLVPVPTDIHQILPRTSTKVRKLVQCLLEEENLARADNDAYSGIIFVTRRDSVLALGQVLSSLPETAGIFRIGCLLGSSASSKRHSFLDITRVMVKDPPADTLRDFRLGDKNLIISTAVAEEGIDIQACGSVIRFDPPPNMVAWAQSRGRARRKKSTFILFDDSQGGDAKVRKWQKTEEDMMAMYNDPTRVYPKAIEEEEEIENDMEFRVPSTAALLTLHSAVNHLYHFCSILPSSGHGNHLPIFEIDPPDYPEGWHAFEVKSSMTVGSPGPWKATCILPRVLPPHLRSFTTEKAYRSKLSARCHAAFIAYVTLYREGLLTDNLLPLWSALDGDVHNEVELLVKEVEQRASTANVPIQMDPFAVVSPVVDKWWCYQLMLGDEHVLRMLTPFTFSSFEPDDFPLLYVPGKKPLKVGMVFDVTLTITKDVLAAARDYTHRIFFPVYGSRMEHGKHDFVHLFLPISVDGLESTWADRRAWQASRPTYGRYENSTQANARLLGERMGYSLDLSIVRDNDKISKLLSFVGWHDGPISTEEEEELRERYDGYPTLDITFPLMVVQSLPRRVNFLVPLESETAGLSNDALRLILPEYATVDLISRDEAEIAMILPSFLRWLSKAITVASLRDNLFTEPSLRSIPLNLLTTAVTAPVSQEANYQRLETLGDTVLKYTISIQLFAEHPYWHEGYLSRRKDHAVNNSQLAKEAVGKGLYRWIIRDRFVPRKWKPRYLDDKPAVDVGKQPDSIEPDTSTGNGLIVTINQIAASPSQVEDKDDPTEENAESPTKGKKKKKPKQDLSTKVLADVVEALIGAAYEHGGFDLAIRCIEVFGLGIPSWKPIISRVEAALSRVEDVDDLPSQLSLVERMLDYRFSHKMLLVEALTHSSYQGDLDNISYERLEFLGDSALDMVVTDYLYHAPGKNYTPGHMHLRKEALVNSHLLAFLCMDISLVLDASMPTWDMNDGVTLQKDSQTISLYQCMLHSSSRVLDDHTVTFSRYQRAVSAIKKSLKQDKFYPWAALTSLQAPKFISDMIESLLGAIFIDCKGDLDTIRRVLSKLGHRAIMEHIVKDEVDVLHPVSRIAIWAAKPDPKRKLGIKVEKQKGEISCVISVDEEEVARATERYRGKSSTNHVRFAAAEEAIKKLRIIEEEEPEDVDEVGWPDDVPAYEW